MEATTGIEPVVEILQTSALPLGYVASFGDPSATRTRDTLIKSQMLCQLS